MAAQCIKDSWAPGVNIFILVSANILMSKLVMKGTEPPVFAWTTMDLDHDILMEDCDGLKVRGTFLSPTLCNAKEAIMSKGH